MSGNRDEAAQSADIRNVRKSDTMKMINEGGGT